ncbi:MAG: hypothetical protein CYPHOPRED_000614 [Cyphobasidiales sp. Tagirdzhanova-0007]|nr:MAG: hypothetical protein CYPHOPRED_000614 [Cyphobasidiales sp. Tagirdzhanova-0007]
MPSYFKPSDSEAWYYRIPAPYLQESAFYTTFIAPAARPSDPTRGRYPLPFSPTESVIRDNPRFRVQDRRIFLNAGKTEWIFYQVLEDKQAIKQHKRNADFIHCHGINDYGGKFTEHAISFLEAGYRLVLPDLPAHGRSTGLHAHVDNMETLVDALDAVVCDVMMCDHSEGVIDAELDARKRFIAGSSMGGFTALSYLIQYSTAPAIDAARSDGIRKMENGLKRPTIDGALLLCPMLAISPETRPSLLVEYIARAIASFAGRWPLAEANRGKNTDDPIKAEEFEADPQTYSGKLRIATGLSILRGITNVNARLSEVTVPFKVFHGTGDRVTNHRGSQRLYEQASSQDKEIQLYDGQQHVLLKVGRDEEDDKKRQRVLKDMLDWLEKH